MCTFDIRVKVILCLYESLECYFRVRPYYYVCQGVGNTGQNRIRYIKYFLSQLV